MNHVDQNVADINQAKYIFDEFEFDCLKGELRHHDELVRLEPQVCQLLNMLISKHGEFVSRQEILDEIWIGRAVSPQVVDNRIRAARMALGDDGKRQRYIKTYPNRGFRFVGEVESVNPENVAHSDLTFGQSFSIARLLRRRAILLPFVASVGVLTASLIIFVDPPILRPSTSESTKERAGAKPVVAVLPLIENRDDIDSKRYGTQLAGVMIDTLSRVSDVDVISSLSSFPVAEQSTNLKDALSILRADFLVTNIIWRDEEGVNATIQLVRADNGVVEWSKNFPQNLQGDSESTTVNSIATEALINISNKLGIETNALFDPSKPLLPDYLALD